MKRILCISGSTREGSTSLALLRTISARHAAEADFQFYDRLAALPHFDPNAEDSELPVKVKELRSLVAAADAVIISTPEYVFSVPAIIKNALEWCVASTVFTDKPTAMIVAAGSGEKTFESLALILKTIQCRLHADAMLNLKGVRAKLLSGELADAEILARLDALYAALLGPA